MTESNVKQLLAVKARFQSHKGRWMFVTVQLCLGVTTLTGCVNMSPQCSNSDWSEGRCNLWVASVIQLLFSIRATSGRMHTFNGFH